MDFAFKPVGGFAPNEAMQCNGFIGTYNPGGMPLVPNKETALVVKHKGDTKYLILRGDWRSQYAAAAAKDGFGACLALYEANKAEHCSPWTTDSEDLAGIFDELSQ